MIPIFLTNHRIVKWLVECASTLSARDYKGLCNQGINGVLYEIHRSDNESSESDGNSEMSASPLQQRLQLAFGGDKWCTRQSRAEQSRGDGSMESFIDMSYRKSKTTEIARALTATYGSPGNQEADRSGVWNGVRIRRLTPRECFRLQGWTDDYFERAQLVNSDSQLYKQAGNGVTVNVIKAIAERIGECDERSESLPE